MENWKVIPEYEGLYEASDLGRIRTADGKTTKNARFTRRVWSQRTLKLKWRKRSNKGRSDARVCLWKDGKESTHLVARLVARAWCSGYAEGLTVNHIDGNPENNQASNLEWISLGENIRKAFEGGLYPTSKPVTVTFKDGTRRSYKSMSECDKALGKANGYTSFRIKNYNGALPGGAFVSK